MEKVNRRGMASNVITGGILGACRGAFFGAYLQGESLGECPDEG
jgi:hypothetical protein